MGDSREWGGGKGWLSGGDIREETSVRMGAAPPQATTERQASPPRRLPCITMQQLSDCTALMERQVSAGRLGETFRRPKEKEHGVQDACVFDVFHSL